MKKVILVYTGLTLFILHFFLILIFCFADHFSGTKLLSVSGSYVFPLFNQDWKMFAPEPPMSNVKLLYQCTFTDSTKSEWTDLGEELLKKHQRNRFWNYGKQYDIYESVCRELISAEENGVEQEQRPETKLARLYVSMIINKKLGSKLVILKYYACEKAIQPIDQKKAPND